MATDLDLRAPKQDHLIDEDLLESNVKAAEVSFDRHNFSPAFLTVFVDGMQYSGSFKVEWAVVSEMLKRSHGNRKDAVEQGGYAVALATAREIYNLYGFGRGDILTGSDYYLIPPGEDDYENALRLEVHGTQDERIGQINYQLRKKVDQLKNGISNLPGLACIVGFRLLTVKFQSVPNA